MGRKPLVHCCHLLSTRAPCLDREAPRAGSLHAFHYVLLNHGELWEALSGPSPVFLGSCLLSTAPSMQENTTRLVPSKARASIVLESPKAIKNCHHPHHSSGGSGWCEGQGTGFLWPGGYFNAFSFFFLLSVSSALCSPIQSRKYYLVREECVQKKHNKTKQKWLWSSHTYASKLFFVFISITSRIWLLFSGYTLCSKS